MNRLTYLLQLHEESPRDAFILFALAKEYEKIGQQDDALKYYLTLKRAVPGYVGLYYHLGKLYEALKQPTDAIGVYREGLQVARAAGDHHAAAELNGARLQIDDDDDF